MCIFKIPAPKPLESPPPVKQLVDTDTTLPDSKQLIDKDEVTQVQYGTGQKKSGPASGKKQGTDALRINLNTGDESKTGGLNV